MASSDLFTRQRFGLQVHQTLRRNNTVDFVEQDQVTLEVCSEEETVQLAQQVQPVWLGPRPRVPKAQGLAPAFERRGVASESRFFFKGDLCRGIGFSTGHIIIICISETHIICISKAARACGTSATAISAVS